MPDWYTALTRLAENGQPDWVIQAQLGHVSPAMMKTYSHVRRKALDEAASALEPPDIASWECAVKEQTSSNDAGDPVTSQSTSQSDNLEAEIDEIFNVLPET